MEQKKNIYGADNDNFPDVIGGKHGFPEHLLRNDIVHFTNYPEDDKSKRILDLIGLHLWRLDDKKKNRIVDFLWQIIVRE